MKPQEGRFQGELFEEFSGMRKKPRIRKRFIPKIETSRLIVPYENIVLLLTGLFVAIILSFSLGVERGKRLAALPQEKDIKVNSAPLRRGKVKVVAAPVLPAAPPEQKAVPVVVSPPVSVPEPKQEPLPLPKEAVKPLKPYTIQVATFEKNDLAEKEMQWLKERGYYVFVIPSSEFLQICVGEYATREQASPNMAELKKRYKDCFLRRRLR